MEEMKEGVVYCVRAASANHWVVMQEPAGHLIASFNRRAAALSYAVSLARGRGPLHILAGAGGSQSTAFGVGHSPQG